MVDPMAKHVQSEQPSKGEQLRDIMVDAATSKSRIELEKEVARLKEEVERLTRGRVKALEWQRRGDDWYSETEVGQYAVGVVFGKYIAMLRGITSGNMNDLRIESQPFKTAREAKRAAQADFERRILSALSPEPAEPGEAPAKPADHASTSPGPVNCSIRKRHQGEDTPRTCDRCTLGPCPFFHEDGGVKR